MLLQDDCFQVLPQQISLADEVKQFALASGFWPAVPRIPISIELREFAQWFGQKQKTEPRGILTYLSELLSAGVEQKVEVGTLKRALATRSWFVTFDGLDEVPHDVKDGVASEVILFLNDIVVEIGSDLLALCTSRPQGYSGQFSELDGPTIELISLSPDQALQCAKPVLELGRSDVEASKYFQILQSAIMSSSVCELMTTPLQSHIMAVVVRDGGRPPERRWQLYNNFYQVIKRREANRDLADKRLAKLLREDTQLLKTVHNRLGFVLHAQSETSKGAQARMECKEFKKLLERAVSQMIDEEVNVTVDALMDAATNRLVLVNTPDDGNHLRFDIRPLQEFFAAEFLYESIGADELRRRMDLIAGDAHWREVMHFLLSALVENGRLTELVVAVEVLERLNDGSGDVNTRLLGRRMGRGTSLTSRLIAEGVLEQDKRIRQQFRKSLEPIGSVVDWSRLDLLGATKSTNSRAWIVAFLIDTLREADKTESIGAAILLTRMLLDGADQVPEIQEMLLAAPPNYFAAILTVLISSESYDQNLNLADWVLTTILKWLLSANWDSLAVDGVRAAIIILRLYYKKLKGLAKELGLAPSQIELISWFFKKDNIRQRETAEISFDYGVLKGYFYFPNWTAPTDAPEWWKDHQDEIASSTGILQLASRIMRFACSGSLADIQSVVTFLKKEALPILQVLPSHVMALVPFDESALLQDSVEALCSLTEEQFRILKQDLQVGSIHMCRPSSEYILGWDATDDQWKSLIENNPTFGLWMCSDEFWNRFGHSKKPHIFSNPNYLNTVISRAIECPVILNLAPELWGKLLENAGERHNELLKAIRSVASKIDLLGRQSQSPVEEFHPFELQLPDDIDLIPPLLNALVQSTENADAKDPSDLLVGVRKQVSLIVNDFSALKMIVQNAETPPNIRVSGAVLILFDLTSPNQISQYKDILIQSYYLGIGAWYFRAICFCLSLLGSEQDDASRSLLTGVLDATRADYRGRRELGKLINVWHETSNAPVSNANVLNNWLEGIH